MEEVIALKQTWHKLCFKCGIKSNNGCNRTLTLDKYLEHNMEPYCNNCYGSLFRPKGYGISTNVQTDYGIDAKQEVALKKEILHSNVTTDTTIITNDLEKLNIQVLEDEKDINTNTTKASPTSQAFANAKNAFSSPSPIATKVESSITKKPLSFGSVAPKCPLCTKSVYKNEEIIALSNSWHKQCFKCGGLAGDGCNRILTLDKYLDHDKQPYCNGCYSKLFRPKGLGFSTNVQTGYGKDPNEEVEHAKKVLNSMLKEETE